MRLHSTKSMGGRRAYTVRSDGFIVGTISERVQPPSKRHWEWSLSHQGDPKVVHGSGMQPTPDEAKTVFRENWLRWLEWAELKE